MAKGNRGGKRGASGASGGASASVLNAEQAIYDLPKNATKKQIQAMVDEMPAGSMIAYRYPSSDNTIVYEKTGKVNAFGKDIWMQYTVIGENGGVSGSYDRGTLINSVQDMARSKTIIKGFTEEQRKKYKSSFESIKKSVMGVIGG